MPKFRQESYIEETKRERIFGDGRVMGKRGSDFLDLSLHDQVYRLGWSHACPIVPRVIAEYGQEWAESHPDASADQIVEAGTRMTIARYAECNFVYGLICDATKKLNKPLYLLLKSPMPRLVYEPDGDHPLDLVPTNHENEMSPLSGPVGFGLPRVVLEGMGRGDDNKDRTSGKIIDILNLVDKIIPQSQTPIELVVKLSEAVVQKGADPQAVLSHLLSEGILFEENCQTQFRNIVLELKNSAPNLYRAYENIDPEKRRELGIVNMKIIEDNIVTFAVYRFNGRLHPISYVRTEKIGLFKHDYYTIDDIPGMEVSFFREKRRKRKNRSARPSQT